MKRKNNIGITWLLLFTLIISSFVVIDSLFYSSSSSLMLNQREIELEMIYNVDLGLVRHLIDNESKKYLLLPVGRIDPERKIVNVYINSIEANPLISNDDHDGYWLNLSLADFESDSTIKIRILNSKTPVTPVYHSGTNFTKWLNPSKYIDSDNLTIVHLARNLTETSTTTREKIVSFRDYIHDEVVSKKSNINDHENASQVLDFGYGVCRHKSRLFIALCRASSIPARSVTGIASKAFDHVYHQWVEYLDEDGFWQQIDPTWGSLTVSDPRLFDIVYARNQNYMYSAEAFNTSSFLASNWHEKQIKKIKAEILISYVMTPEIYLLVNITGSLTALISTALLFREYNGFKKVHQWLLKTKNRYIE